MENNIVHFSGGRFIHKETMTITEQFIKIRTRYNKFMNRCPFCKQELTEIGRNIYLLVNNYMMFPNIFVHKDCYDERGDWVGCVELEVMYKKYNDFLVENNGIWRNEEK